MYLYIIIYIYCIVLHVLLWSTVQRITIHVIRFLSVMSRISQRPQVVHQQKGLMSRPVVVEISTCRCGFSLWLCQNSYGKWLSIVDFPIQNGDVPSFFGTVYQRVASKFQLKPKKKYPTTCSWQIIKAWYVVHCPAIFLRPSTSWTIHSLFLAAHFKARTGSGFKIWYFWCASHWLRGF